MSQVVLVHPLKTFKVQTRLIVLKCDLFTRNPSLAASQYTVRSDVSLADFGAFVSALEGHSVKITNDNFKGLSALCDEFRFVDLGATISQFQDSDDFREAETVQDSEARRRLSVLEDRMQQRDREIASVHGKLLRQSQAQESATEAVLGRVSQLEADHAVVGSLSREMAHLKELQSVLSDEIERVRQQLREVNKSADNAKDIGLVSRAVAAEAQKTFEAHLGRVSRIETDLLALRRELVLAQAKPPATAPTSPRSGARAQSPSAAGASSAVPAAPHPMGLVASVGWNSAIVPDFPKLFEDLGQKFTILWRGSRDGFGAREFHRCCDGHPNTLTVILDTDGNIFGGFTPVAWASPKWNGRSGTGDNRSKADPSLKSFLFTLKNPRNIPPRRFALQAKMKDKAIICRSDYGPDFYDISVWDNCNGDPDSYTSDFGGVYTNDTGLAGKTFFTGSQHFQVKEIEVFEISE
jgi:hypothetical protein